MPNRKVKSGKTYKVTKYAQALLRYWINSLEEGARIEEASKLQQSSFIEVSNSDLKSSNLPNAVFAKISALASSRDKGLQQKSSFTVVISPLTIIENGRWGRKNVFHPLLIPASISFDGNLSVIEETPFIQRGFLEPADDDYLPSIGSLKFSDKFCSKYGTTSFKDISSLLKYSEDFFKYVTGSRYEDFQIDDYEVIAQFKVGPFEFKQGSISHLSMTLKDVLQGKRKSNLLEVVTNKKLEKKILFKRSKYGMYVNSKAHVAQFSPHAPLSRSQRRSLHRINEIGIQEIIPVSGPPGTGKTTLLQNIVANCWTQAALKNSSTPPVIVVCGATNQSVLNVISSFGSEQSGVERWFPDIHSYGTFCSSFSKAEEADQYQVEQLDGSGFFSKIEAAAFVKRSKDTYVENFHGYANKRLSLRDSIRYINKELKGEYSRLSSSLGADFELSLKDIFFPGLSILNEEKERTYLDQQKQYDSGIRYKMFFLATHYWEARWLLQMEKDLENGFIKKRKQLAKTKEDWVRRAMLTPVFVSTTSMVSKFFGEESPKDGAPIDLLFYDEAGQIPPEKAVVSLALSNKAIVIGDTKQLSPYTSIPEVVDQSNLIKAGLLKNYDEADFKGIIKKGISASSNNLMELAIHHCKRYDGLMMGASLEEHRRSVPEIAQFCNVLCYQHRLKPVRPQPKEILFHAFCYVDVGGRSIRIGPSRRNQEEAREIYSWLRLNEEKISSFYNGRPLHELVACITPFTQQEKYLESLLKKDWPEMLIGTVQSIQGAEREIVIFSPSYDAEYKGEYVYDRDTRMLNVAVSRARDSFIVIGEMELFRRNSGEDIPSNLLGEFLFRKEENKLDLSVGVEETFSEYNIVDHVDTLEGHRNLLRYVLSKAKRKVLIASAGISSFAIKNDNLGISIRRAVERGVQVVVYTDNTLDLEDDKESKQNAKKIKQTAVDGRDMLDDALAEVIVSDKIHTKALIMDDELLANGSFNWLSAVRTEGSANQKYETTTIVTGNMAKEGIKRISSELDKRGKMVWKREK